MSATNRSTHTSGQGVVTAAMLRQGWQAISQIDHNHNQQISEKTPTSTAPNANKNRTTVQLHPRCAHRAIDRCIERRALAAIDYAADGGAPTPDLATYQTSLAMLVCTIRSAC